MKMGGGGRVVCCSKQAGPSPNCPLQQLKSPKDRYGSPERRRNNGGDGVRDEMEEGRRRRRGDEGIVRGGLLRSCSEGVGQHERQDVMVYSAQEWGRRGQGVPCPQHQPQCDL